MPCTKPVDARMVLRVALISCLLRSNKSTSKTSWSSRAASAGDGARVAQALPRSSSPSGRVPEALTAFAVARPRVTPASKSSPCSETPHLRGSACAAMPRRTAAFKREHGVPWPQKPRKAVKEKASDRKTWKRKLRGTKTASIQDSAARSATAQAVGPATKRRSDRGWHPPRRLPGPVSTSSCVPSSVRSSSQALLLRMLLVPGSENRAASMTMNMARMVSAAHLSLRS
mmetsp:Transcript_88506/g.245887  ORF Transcript_88506/g.245887 Transcript_88506/m.245887 type:complete len:229 (-) Transcript_88506:962-1648(-)